MRDQTLSRSSWNGRTITEEFEYILNPLKVSSFFEGHPYSLDRRPIYPRFCIIPLEEKMCWLEWRIKANKHEIIIVYKTSHMGIFKFCKTYSAPPRIPSGSGSLNFDTLTSFAFCESWQALYVIEQNKATSYMWEIKSNIFWYCRNSFF